MTHDDHFALAHAPTPVLVAIILALFIVGSSVAPIDDNSYEYAQSDLMLLDQRNDDLRLAAVKDCLDTAGEGAAVGFDSNDVVSGCGQRRK